MVRLSPIGTLPQGLMKFRQFADCRRKKPLLAPCRAAGSLGAEGCRSRELSDGDAGPTMLFAGVPGVRDGVGAARGNSTFAQGGY